MVVNGQQHILKTFESAQLKLQHLIIEFVYLFEYTAEVRMPLPKVDEVLSSRSYHSDNKFEFKIQLNNTV